ncbi:extracellular solute-binding protein [Anaerosporobacter sp.]|uniref:extracellular solute-binding protein n=1 Tax=Anaerosporobacter sp. TaxID=1872529 RepID=UPI00286EFB0B|nr:extracellular solute-binding protein [Anaerosporobacter sp.]
MKVLKKRRIVSLLVIMCMVVSMLSGCKSSNSKNKNVATDANETKQDATDTKDTTADDKTADTVDTAEDLEPITFTFYNADGSREDPWTDPIAQEITKQTGVKLEMDYPVDGDDQRISLMIASEEYPDLIFAKGDVDALVAAGAMIDMSDLIDQYGPNIKALYGEEYNKLRYTKDDPGIYQLCSAGVGNIPYRTSGTAQLQYAVLEANNYEIPKTLAQYEKMIKDYKAANPTIDGLDTIGITLSCSDWHWYITLANPSGFIANASPDNGQWIVNDANGYEATYKHASEGQKEYYQWLNRMYLEGILDPDFATQTHDDYIAKLSTGRVLAIMDADWDYADAETVLKSEGKSERTYCGLPITMNEDQKAPSLMNQGLTVGWGVGITKACKDPVRAVKYLNWLCSDEAQVLVGWGIKDVNYFLDEEGHRYRTAEEEKLSQEDTEYRYNTGIGIHNYPFPTYGDGVVDPTGSTYTTNSKENVIKNYTDAQKKAVDAWGVELLTEIFPQADEFDIPDYAPVYKQNLTEEFNAYATKLDEIAWSGLISCVMAKEGGFDKAWDKMQADFEKAGVVKASELLTEQIQQQVDFWSTSN